MNKAELGKIREMHNRGYKPGNLDVEEMFAHIDAQYAEIDKWKGIATRADEACDTAEHELSALRETQKAREAAAREKIAAEMSKNLVVKANKEGRYFVALLDPEGDHLFSAPDWGWYEGTLQHRNEMVERLVDIVTVAAFKPDSALDDLLREARLAEAEWWIQYTQLSTHCACDADCIAAFHGLRVVCAGHKRLAALRAPLEPEGKHTPQSPVKP